MGKQKPANKPERTFRLGVIGVSVFRNEYDDGTGYRTCSCTKSYQDASEQWKYSSSFRAQELPTVLFLMNKALEYMHEMDTAESMGINLASQMSAYAKSDDMPRDPSTYNANQEGY